MTLSDSRRLTGPNLVLDGPGAAAEISINHDTRDAALDSWLEACAQIAWRRRLGQRDPDLTLL